MTKQLENLSSDLAAFALAHDCDCDTAEGANKLVTLLASHNKPLLNRHSMMGIEIQLEVLEQTSKKYNRAAFFVATNFKD